MIEYWPPEIARLLETGPVEFEIPPELFDGSRTCRCEQHDISDYFHGTISGYTTHGCRCLDCNKVVRDYYRTAERKIITQQLNMRRTNARRARKKGVASEDYSREGVARRDGWRCGICGTPINPHLKWPNRESLSIDHVIPLSRGGSDLASNVQASHLVCNIRKNDKVPEEGAA